MFNVTSKFVYNSLFLFTYLIPKNILRLIRLTLSKLKISWSTFFALFPVLRKIRILVILPDGCKILWPLYDYGTGTIIHEIYRSRLYELIQTYKPTRNYVIIDVGSHIGTYSLKSSKAVGNTGRVFAIEPNPRNYSLLLKDIKLNKATNIVPIQAAISDSNGEITLHIIDSAWNSGGSFIHSRTLKRDPQREKYVVDNIKVKTVTLDALIYTLDINRVDILKVDVEGAELLVLKGAERAFSHKIIKHVIVEIGKEDISSVVILLKKAGYTIEKIVHPLGYLEALLYAKLEK